MAEMLVDGAKLDACNTAEADAIRAKTGGSADIPFDFANNKGFADAIAAIPSGGSGGAALFSGTVELVDTTTSALTIPVDCSDADFFVVLAHVDRTGLVQNGDIVYDSEPMVHSENGTFVWYIAAYYPNPPTQKILRDDTNYSGTTNPHNQSYAYLSRGNNGAQLGMTVTISRGHTINLNTLNASRFFCKTGCYVRFAYSVWRGKV